MLKVSAVTCLKIKERPKGNIIVFTDRGVTIADEVFNFYGRAVQAIRRNNGFSHLTFSEGGQVFLIPKSLDGNLVRGVRGNLIIIDGSEVEQQVYNEVIIPFMSIGHDMDFTQKLSRLCGFSVREYSQKNEVVFVGEGKPEEVYQCESDEWWKKILAE